VSDIQPHLETLPPAQRLLWPKLSAVGLDFVLYGGSALSLQVGGRTSVDFDFFTADPVDADKIAARFSFLEGARLQQRSEATATFLVGHGEDAVAVSFFGALAFGRVGAPVRFADNGIYAASLLDLAAQKVKVVQQRAEMKDYLDIDALIRHGIALEMALGAARALYPQFNPVISLKALGYFDDVPKVAPEIRKNLTTAVLGVKQITEVPKQANSLLPPGAVR
jgi:hypothetical protein